MPARLYLDVSAEVSMKELSLAFWELSRDEQLEVFQELIENSHVTLRELVEELSE